MNEIEQQRFLANIQELLDQAKGFRKNTVFAMMEPRLLRCEPEVPAVTLAYPGRAWEENGNGVLHGGITAAMMDVAMGTLTYGLTGTVTPTMNLNISYPRPAKGGGSFLIRAEAAKAGRTALYVSAVMYEEAEPDKPVATAQGVFFNPTGKYPGEN